MLPGMTQLFSLLKIEEVDRAKTFDAVVLDMPASGEATVSVFPSLWAAWAVDRTYRTL